MSCVCLVHGRVYAACGCSASWCAHSRTRALTDTHAASHSSRIPLVLFRTGFRNTIYDVLKSKYGWKETDSDTDWDFIWADVGWIRDYYDHIHLDDHQRVNHFRNHYELARKDLLVKNVNRMKKQVRA